ncbi:helix-turn-helix transcriptional regulator [Parafrankia sp. FMc6]|uniref:helix-turn-helix domain-containing protein n=1 Tax=Parafrankia soli TaxID=2599596 RepID=UPI0034D61CD7
MHTDLDDLRVCRGNRIRALRELHGMSQSELARQAHIGQTHLWRIEAGKTGVGDAVLIDLAKALETEVADLFAHRGAA